jgi:hypothetical protein
MGRPAPPAQPPRPKIVTDPITGFAALTAGPGAPKLTSEEVAEILKDFPWVSNPG